MTTEQPITIINDDDLRKNQYDIVTLEKNMDNLWIKVVLHTQKLTADFCVKYILTGDYDTCEEDTYITTNNILACQPHITPKELDDACAKWFNERYGVDYYNK